MDDDKLVSISETKNIVKNRDSAEVDGKKLNSDSLVSMNFWCYPQMFLDVLKEGFPRFLSELNDPMKDEYLLPVIADQMLKNGVNYSVLPTTAQWFGVTYKEDKPSVIEGIHQLHSSGVYREDLYSDLM